MNKTELIASVAGKVDISKKDAEKSVNAVFEVIGDTLANAEKVQIIGFGTFEVRYRKAREGRNPQNNDTIKIAASHTPAFKAGKQLKTLVNENK